MILVIEIIHRYIFLASACAEFSVRPSCGESQRPTPLLPHQVGAVAAFPGRSACSSWNAFRLQKLKRKMELSWNGGTPKNHPNFSGIVLYKPTILGYPHLWKPANRASNLQLPDYHGASQLVLSISCTLTQVITRICHKQLSWSWFHEYHW